MRIAVVGTGYVGLVTGTCFAEMGNTVTCVDIDATKVEHMKRGRVPIYEPGLEEIFSRNAKEDRLTFTTELATAVKNADLIFLALPTPPNEDGSADLSYILGVAKQLGTLLDHYTIILNKSTVPVGTAEAVSKAIKKQAKVDFDVVSNPEFLREGFAVDDFMKPDRVVIGTGSEQARKILSELYAPFVRQGNPVYFMDERSAEMTKYAANSFLATKITFMNEIANLCEKTGADVDAVRLGIGSDDRIGKRFLFPGIGYGGSCFPKDVLALQKTAKEYESELHILDAVTEVNEAQKHVLFHKVKRYYGGELQGKVLALWGLAFKPDTDDIREAPALYLIDDLLAAGATIQAYDPEAGAQVKKKYTDNDKLIICDHEYDALASADALLIATEWSVFRTPDFGKIQSDLKKPVIFDGRNLYEPTELGKLGFYYESIGRQTVKGN